MIAVLLKGSEMTESQNEDPLLFTLHDLHNRTAEIAEILNTQNKPAVITGHGRYLLFIQPLANIDNLEGKLISAAVEAGKLDLNSPVDRIYTS